MTQARNIHMLVRAHMRGDSGLFYNVAESIAVDAERARQTKVASDLMGLIAKGRAQAEGPKPPVTLPHGMEGLVEVVPGRHDLGDLMVTPALTADVARLLRELREGDRLRERGFAPRRKLLLSGPPGTGKTMTASVLAKALDLPLCKVRLDGVISRHLGETGAKLRLVFDMARQVRAVYLFDEVDAIASDRGNANDVGEARRITNSLLTMLDEDDSGSVLVATTNHADLVDRAAFRRFDSVLVFGLPEGDVASRLVSARLAGLDLSGLDLDALAGAMEGLGHADLVAAAEDAGRTAVLDHDDRVTTVVLGDALARRGAGRTAV